MKALILSAGKCSRLMPLTNTKHKCLIDIYDNTKIIDIELENLKECGVKDPFKAYDEKLVELLDE